MQEIRAFKGESNYSHLPTEFHDVLATIMLIWEYIGHKASLIVPVPS